MAAPALHILAFEPFDAGSHRAVRESISRHSRHRWVWITRPGRAWKWRMRLAAVEMVEDAQAQRRFNEPVDVIFATSLMGVADLRALLPSHLRTVPLVLYMHENQAAYPGSSDAWMDDEFLPQRDAESRDAHFALTNLTSVMAADVVIWNSEWNRGSFIAGIDRLLQHAPDSSLSVAGVISSKSQVIWPPVEPPPAALNDRDGVLHNATAGGAMDRNRPIRVVWPHRWEHDKGPDELLEIATRLTEAHNLRWTILGERFRNIPAAMIEFGERFRDRIDHFGFEPDRAAYWRRLGSCDWVLSTARHEFFGMAVVEALLAGCLPWLPDRLSYPEILPPQARNLTPMHLPDARSSLIRKAILTHLEPTIGPRAVGRVDTAIDNVTGKRLHNVL